MRPVIHSDWLAPLLLGFSCCSLGAGFCEQAVCRFSFFAPPELVAIKSGSLWGSSQFPRDAWAFSAPPSHLQSTQPPDCGNAWLFSAAARSDLSEDAPILSVSNLLATTEPSTCQRKSITLKPTINLLSKQWLSNKVESQQMCRGRHFRSTILFLSRYFLAVGCSLPNQLALLHEFFCSLFHFQWATASQSVVKNAITICKRSQTKTATPPCSNQ